MTEADIELENSNWRTLLSEPESESAEAVNNLVRLAKEARERGNPNHAKMLHAFALRLGYHFAKDAGVYVEMKRLKGHSLIKGGWHDGTFFAVYGSGDKVYSYPSVTEEQFVKLCRSPFPDRLWAGYRKALEAAKSPSG